MRRLLLTATSLFALLLVPLTAFAANEGQADLDKATELQLAAESQADLEKVVGLAESAIQKGLDKDQEAFAKQIIGATLYQHASGFAAAIFEQSPPSSRWRLARDSALKDIDKAKKYSPELPDLYLLEAKLRMLPDGDEKAAHAAINEAIKLLKAKDEPKELAKALILRAQMSEENEKKLADFDAAVKADPSNSEALQGRALMYLQIGDSDKALADLKTLSQKDGDNPAAIGAMAEVLTNLKKYDEALNYANKVIELAPQSTLGYNLRSRIHVMKDDLKAATKDLDKALEIDDEDIPALLMRSRLHAAQDDDAKAKADIEKALQLRPDLPQGILLKSMLAAQQKKFGEAIGDLQTLLQSDPTNAEYRLQLATYLVGDNRPRKAIDVLTSIIDGITDDKNSDQKDTKADALRARGDALLSIGKHAEAVADYKESLKLDGEDTGVLNNLAWVLATSPEESVRDPAKSIEYGLKACELTKYEKPHILSTLAAGYAEKGDWENALKWSAKAVELGAKEEDVSEQLQKELDSYKQKKPWREKQEIEENTKPLTTKSNDLET